MRAGGGGGGGSVCRSRGRISRICGGCSRRRGSRCRRWRGCSCGGGLRRTSGTGSSRSRDEVNHPPTGLGSGTRRGGELTDDSVNCIPHHAGCEELRGEVLDRKSV